MPERLRVDGCFYKHKIEEHSYTPELRACIEGTVQVFLDQETTSEKPAMLLGKVQAGKTFAYSGIMALAMDNGYDVIIVLTKGTKFLLTQTYLRMKNEFAHFIEEDDLHVFDIMESPFLTGYLLKKKLIIVSKKEDDNLRRLIDLFSKDYPVLQYKKTLLIDDEADFASVGFKHTKEEGIKINTIAKQISDLRNVILSSDYLQVTATPYSLYLQPDSYAPHEFEIKPNRPAFTYVVPMHDKYIGSDHFYGELSSPDNQLYYRLFGSPPVSKDELGILSNIHSIKLYSDANYAQYYLSEHGVPTLWSGLLGFIVGACVRRWQSRVLGEKEKKYAFIIHTDTRKNRHDWQHEIVKSCLRNFETIATENEYFFKKFVSYFLEDFSIAMQEMELPLPSEDELFEELIMHLKEGYVGLYQVNSDNEAENLLSPTTGQLRLLNPMNIFIGGFIFDRGVTIDNLIGFYYGRNPRTFQQDTVVQHQRIFGARDPKDLTVTRLYTSLYIYSVMQKIHEFDVSLWETIEHNGVDASIQFIRKVRNTIRPCSPNKVLLSNLLSITPGKRLLPYGFRTTTPQRLSNITATVDAILTNLGIINAPDDPLQISFADFEKIARTVWESYVFERGYGINLEHFITCTKYLSNLSQHPERKGTVNLLVRTDRTIAKIRTSTGRFEDAPDSSKGEKSELKIAKRIAIDTPSVILLRQNGKKQNGWSGIPFYWIVVVAPQNVKTVIFSDVN